MARTVRGGRAAEFDAITQRNVAPGAQGRTFARFAVRQQLLWVVGALIPVAITLRFSVRRPAARHRDDRRADSSTVSGDGSPSLNSIVASILMMKSTWRFTSQPPRLGTSHTCPTWSSSAVVSRGSRRRKASLIRMCASRSSTSTTSTPSCRSSTKWRPRGSSRPTSPIRSARSSAQRETCVSATDRCAASTARATSSPSTTARDRLRPPRHRDRRDGRVLRHPRRVAVRHAAVLAGRRASTAQSTPLDRSKTPTSRADDRRVGLNFVIVGGGPTGVETSGALSELITHRHPPRRPSTRPRAGARHPRRHGAATADAVSRRGECLRAKRHSNAWASRSSSVGPSSRSTSTSIRFGDGERLECGRRHLGRRRQRRRRAGPATCQVDVRPGRAGARDVGPATRREATTCGPSATPRRSPRATATTAPSWRPSPSSRAVTAPRRSCAWCDGQSRPRRSTTTTRASWRRSDVTPRSPNCHAARHQGHGSAGWPGWDCTCGTWSGFATSCAS